MSNKSGLELTKKVLEPLYRKYRERREFLKKMAQDRSLPLEKRFSASLMLQKLPRRSSKVRQVSRCLVTGKTGTFRLTNMCMYQTRMYACEGLLPGIRKKSW